MKFPASSKALGIALFLLLIGAQFGPPLIRANPNVEQPAEPAPEPVRHHREAFKRKLPTPVKLPGEFGRLSAVLLSADELVHFHPHLFAFLVAEISERAPVIAVVSSDEQLLEGREALEEAGIDVDRVHFLIHQLDSMWMRDFGPIFLRRSDGSAAIIDTHYAARDDFGERQADDQFPIRLANALNLPCFYVPISMEGGNLVHNGSGLGICTVKMIERNRFRNFAGDEFSGLFNSYFSLKQLTFVPPLPGEPTGHADMFLAFTGARSLVLAEMEASQDLATYEALERSRELIEELAVDGQKLTVRRIPLPPRKDGFWRSYTNVFFVNGLLLVPSYSDLDPLIEVKVKETYQSLLPDWEIKSVPADELIETGGFLHCLTLGIPHFVDVRPLLELAD